MLSPKKASWELEENMNCMCNAKGLATVWTFILNFKVIGQNWQQSTAVNSKLPLCMAFSLHCSHKHTDLVYNLLQPFISVQGNSARAITSSFQVCHEYWRMGLSFMLDLKCLAWVNCIFPSLTSVFSEYSTLLSHPLHWLNLSVTNKLNIHVISTRSAQQLSCPSHHEAKLACCTWFIDVFLSTHGTVLWHNEQIVKYTDQHVTYGGRRGKGEGGANMTDYIDSDAT